VAGQDASGKHICRNLVTNHERFRTRSINATSRRLAGTESTAMALKQATLRGLKGIVNTKCEAASVDLYSFRQARRESGFANLACQARRSSLDLLARSLSQRVLWAEAHAHSSFRRIIALMAGFFGPPANQHSSFENAQHLVALGCFFPSRDPRPVSLHRIDRQENVSAYLGLLA
jgi:hypothetical protein